MVHATMLDPGLGDPHGSPNSRPGLEGIQGPKDRIYISYHIISCRVVSCHVMSCHVISYHIISYHIIYIYYVNRCPQKLAMKLMLNIIFLGDQETNNIKSNGDSQFGKNLQN